MDPKRMSLSGSGARFESSGYFFTGLLALVLLGFWPSYFSRFFDGTADFSFYFHFHAVMASLWIASLIVQPVLIRNRKLRWHRAVGRLSYLVIPLFFLSVILLAHSRINPEDPAIWLSLWIPFKDLIIFGIFYFIAIRYRRMTDIHARAMIVAGMTLIEPALARVVQNTLFPGPAFMPAGYLVTIGIIYSVLIALMIRERGQKRGRWVFPLGLGLFMFVQSVILFEFKIGPWQAFAEWFASLALT